MPISRGSAWGAPGALPDDGVVVGSDADASAAVAEARRAGAPVPVLGLVGGDLWRTLGAPGGGLDRLRSPAAVTVQVDIGEALLDGRLCFFVAHLVARTRWWRRGFVALNTPWLGAWNAGPRAHPNDGLLDTFDVRLSLGQALAVRRRLPTGSHLPHPGLKERRSTAVQVTLDRPMPVWLDGRRLPEVGSVRNLSVRVEPDALTVVV